jgi:Photosynthesis affected mutant 68
MSASWDIDREGSLFGFDEFQTNIKNIQGGFSRTRENTLLKSKMEQLSPEEIQIALNDLEQREKKEQEVKRNQSLQTKLQDELK